MKTYLLATGMLISGILAIASVVSFGPSNQPMSSTISAYRSQQSEFYTSVTSLGDITITEILVNTSVQFPPGGLVQFNPPSYWLVVGVILGIWIIVLGLSSSHKVQSGFG